MKINPWWSEQVQQAVLQKMITFRKWMKTKRVEDIQSYKIARKEAENIERKEDGWKRSKKRQHWNE